jgi:hypothetical protein
MEEDRAAMAREKARRVSDPEPPSHRELRLNAHRNTSTLRKRFHAFAIAAMALSRGRERNDLI